MTLLFMDGFDHYDGNNSNLALGQYLSVDNAELTATVVRTGTRSVRGSTASSGELIFGFPALQSDIGFGFGYYFQSAPVSAKLLAALTTSAGSTSLPNLSFVHLPSGAIEVRRGNAAGTVILTTNPSVLVAGAWNHIEIRAVASDSAGSVEIRVNEVIVGTVSAVDTVYSGTAHFASLQLDVSAIGTSTNVRYFDDLYVWNSAGTMNNDFIGDRRVITLLPNANQATQEMTVTGAANAYTAIRSADGDTSYITASDSVPVTSEFALENAGDNVGAINAVQTVVLARKTEAGAATMQVSMISGGDVDAGDVHSIADSYSYYEDVFETNPDTGAPWNASTISSATFRLRRIS